MARKPFKGTVADNVQAYGTGAINVDGCRIGTGTGEVKTVMVQDIRGGNYNNGGKGRIEHQRVDQGKWPANVLHDSCEDVLRGMGGSGTILLHA